MEISPEISEPTRDAVRLALEATNETANGTKMAGDIRFHRNTTIVTKRMDFDADANICDVKATRITHSDDGF